MSEIAANAALVLTEESDDRAGMDRPRSAHENKRTGR